MRMMIAVGRGTRDALKKDFGASLSTISNALNYKRDNKRASEIRCAAVNVYGGLLLKV